MQVTSEYNHGYLTLTVWGHGTSVAIEHAKDGRNVHWQGDEASEILDRLDKADVYCEELENIWDEYEHIAEKA